MFHLILIILPDIVLWFGFSHIMKNDVGCGNSKLLSPRRFLNVRWQDVLFPIHREMIV